MSRTTKYSPPEDLCMQFYGTFSYIHTRSLIDVRLCLKSSWHQLAYIYGPKKKCHKTAYSNLPEDEHLDDRNMSMTT